MAYADTPNTTRRIGAAGAVTLIQIGLGYALVMGLAGTILSRPAPHPTEATNIPLPKPKPRIEKPTVEPRPVIRPVQHDSHQIVEARPTVITPVTSGAVEGGVLGGTGGAIEEVRLPQPDPQPSPALAVRGAKPRGTPGLWVTPNDYPAAELRLEHAGVTRFRLSVGPDGRVRNCTVTGLSGWPALDTVACAKLSARARFDPALDSTGARVEGSYTSSVRWQIPE